MHELYLNNITELAHELTYQRYLLNQGQANTLFQELSIPEYIALHYLSRAAAEKDNETGKTYLRDIAAELKLSIPQTSRMVGQLRDKGLVSWSHDGDGSEGTYIIITDSGLRQMETQETLLKDYYSRVTEKFGRENLTTLLELMIELEKVMDSELIREGDGPDGI